MKRFFTLCLLLLCGAGSLWANNLQISQAAISNLNTTEKTLMVNFDVSWMNSWRNATNYDGVWIFVKFQKTGSGEWFGATLSTNAVNHLTGDAGANATINPRGDGKGVFFYRSANGGGNFGSNGVQLKWNYGLDSLINNFQNDIQKISVFAIEMVYVPQGSFYLGSGGGEHNRFIAGGTTNDPFQVTSENAITIGNQSGNLKYTQDNQNDGDMLGPIPAEFPKGYNAFWCMKYEITQEQYVDFLNTQPRNIQAQRVATNINSTSISNRYVMSGNSTIQHRNGIRCDAAIPAAPQPVTFYCDFNGNGTPNEDGDGKDIACNLLSWDDGIAYSVWAGLRPMTELEYEKACRGPLAAATNEYAWGTTNIYSAYNMLNSGFGYETVLGNCNMNPSTTTQANPFLGPLKVGIFAQANTNREQAGASYYGIMEMSGNLWERCITIGTGTGRQYNPALISHPLVSGSGFRGGSWYSNLSNYLRVSDRYNAALTDNARNGDYGFRCIGGLN